MKKQILLLILSLTPICVWCQITAQANGLYYNIDIDNQTAEVIAKLDKYYGHIVIPKTIKYGGVECSVTSIGKKAFYRCKKLTSIVIPNSVTKIEEFAFADCNSLTSINIPQSVLCIEEGAFSGCLRLKHIYCYAEKMPVTNNTSFDDIYASDVILHVSAEAVEAYKNTKPWNQIGRIVALDDKEIPSETKDVLGKGFDDEIIIKATGYISSSNVILNEVEPFFVVSSALDKDLKGCPVKCKVTQVRKSNISGSEGRLIIHPLYIKKGNEKVKVFGDIYVRGKNRTNVKFWLGFLPPMWFIPGTGAKIYKDDCFTIYLR